MDLEATALAQFKALMTIASLAVYGPVGVQEIQAIVTTGLGTSTGARLLAEYQARRETMTTAQALDGLEMPRGD